MYKYMQSMSYLIKYQVKFLKNFVANVQNGYIITYNMNFTTWLLLTQSTKYGIFEK